MPCGCCFVTACDCWIVTPHLLIAREATDWSRKATGLPQQKFGIQPRRSRDRPKFAKSLMIVECFCREQVFVTLLRQANGDQIHMHHVCFLYSTTKFFAAVSHSPFRIGRFCQSVFFNLTVGGERAAAITSCSNPSQPRQCIIHQSTCKKEMIKFIDFDDLWKSSDGTCFECTKDIIY